MAICLKCRGDVWIEVSAGPPGPPELRLCAACQTDAPAVNKRLDELERDRGPVALAQKRILRGLERALLRETDEAGRPVFDRGNVRSIVRAVERAAKEA